MAGLTPRIERTGNRIRERIQRRQEIRVAGEGNEQPHRREQNQNRQGGQRMNPDPKKRRFGRAAQQSGRGRTGWLRQNHPGRTMRANLEMPRVLLNVGNRAPTQGTVTIHSMTRRIGMRAVLANFLSGAFKMRPTDKVAGDWSDRGRVQSESHCKKSRSSAPTSSATAIINSPRKSTRCSSADKSIGSRIMRW